MVHEITCEIRNNDVSLFMSQLFFMSVKTYDNLRDSASNAEETMCR